MEKLVKVLIPVLFVIVNINKNIAADLVRFL
jgi:hypothetical protein